MEKEVKKMELVKVESKTKIDLKDNTVYEAKYYKLGGYEVDHFVTTYEDGEKWDRVCVSFVDYQTARESYLPEINFEGDFFGEKVRRFKIQTCAYGALAPEEIHKVIAGYNTALEAVEILTKEFC